jgi:cell division septation protein DedD
VRIPWPRGRAEDILQRAVLLTLSVALAGLIGLAIVAFVSSQDTAHQALATRDQTAKAASARIDQLQTRITGLQAELEVAKSQRGELIAKVDALGMQIAALGGKPVARSASSTEVTATTTTTAPAAPTPSPTTTAPPAQPPPSSPPTTQPPAPPSCQGVEVIGLCLAP